MHIKYVTAKHQKHNFPIHYEHNFRNNLFTFKSKKSDKIKRWYD